MNDKPSAEIPIEKLERIAGDDWLLEVAAQAQQLHADAEPHPTKKALIVVTLRNGETHPRLKEQQR
ncbi:hypothetical protein ERD78_01725 [Allopusillimonas soli]|uniref:Uncharacterized protein n=1 Tax=Allopusillimonas soli TaxID=659016 RepID=A0A853FBY4_9BURK|nr:hypothetical protein [Allopusillimonas soli]NYT35576.1 hypothetical protein [Allopusillimonas soli]TEA75979.1 hypothetical protein ERD78_01725 [Allopusillimonas soli]